MEKNMNPMEELITRLMKERARATGKTENIIFTKDARCCFPECREWAYGYDESIDDMRRDYFRKKPVCSKHGGPSWSDWVLHNLGERLKEPA